MVREKGAEEIPRLLFVDDYCFLVEPFKSNLLIYVRFFIWFESTLRLKINLERSEVIIVE